MQWRIRKLDKLRDRGALFADERWFILRIFYALHEEAEKHGIKGLNARSLTSVLRGKAKCTVGKVVTSWLQGFREKSENDDKLKEAVFIESKRGNLTKKEKNT